MQGTEFLQHVWRLQTEAAPNAPLPAADGVREHPLRSRVALAVKKSADDWDEGTIPAHIAIRAPQLVDVDSSHYALYFCPNVFRMRRRKGDTFPGRWLYQDLDEVHPHSCPMRPTIWWETSPDRYQGLWLLDEHLEPDRLASLNKALNRACEADPGTWNLTRLLRVPGSWNGKRDCRVSDAVVEDHVRLVEPETVLV